MLEGEPVCGERKPDGCCSSIDKNEVAGPSMADREAELRFIRVEWRLVFIPEGEQIALRGSSRFSDQNDLRGAFADNFIRAAFAVAAGATGE